MSGVNKVILIGRLGKDPELKYTPSGAPVANFTMATSENWTDKNGEKQENTEWHKIVVWGRQAEICGEYLSKGKQVYLEGRIQTRSWEDKEGNTRYITEIKASNIVFLGSRDGGSGNSGSMSEPGSDSGSGEPDDGDIPF